MKAFKFSVIADTHYYSPVLGVSGRAYELRSGSDQKCLAESPAILKAVFEKIASDDSQALLIAGDLTNNGERASHEEFRQMLYDLQKVKRVYVITNTHDWCSDDRPHRYDADKVIADVPVLGHHELRGFYADFGPNEAISEYITHLGTSSYILDLNQNTRLLALSDDQSGRGGAGYSQKHLSWIEDQISQTKALGKNLVAMQHHLLMPHVCPLITKGSCIQDREYVGARFADAGLKYIFCGHSHIQDIARLTSPKGNTITEINVGSAVGYPAPIIKASISRGGLCLDLDRIESFTYEGKQEAADPYLRRHLASLVENLLHAAAFGDKKEFIDRFDAMHINSRKLLKFRFLLKAAARFILKADIKQAARLLNLISLGRAVKKRDVKAYAQRPLMDFVRDILFAVFDGGAQKHSVDSHYYKLVTSAVAIPGRLFKKKPLFKDLNDCIHALVAGNDLNVYPNEL
ncbi:MAG: metallophosphoesterase [Clostridiales bacterium]|nr:metallophosphoesterase [Clostridiales bacterium]